MDGFRFDLLTRALGQSGNRRAFLRGVLGFGGVAVARSALRDSDAEAARRPAPTQTPVSCPGNQIWNGSACVRPFGSTACGPDCCPDGQSACCDNACCAGQCYGEELCCPTGSTVCQGAACCSAGEVCLSDGSCCTPLTCPTGTPDRLYGCGSGSDGCGGTLDCACPDNWLCFEEEPRNFCANLSTTCIPGVTASANGKIGFCDSTLGFCANTVIGNETVCVSMTEAICNDCASDADCSAISGAVCVQAFDGVCPSSTTTMCAQAL